MFIGPPSQGWERCDTTGLSDEKKACEQELFNELDREYGRSDRARKRLVESARRRLEARLQDGDNPFEAIDGARAAAQAAWDNHVSNVQTHYDSYKADFEDICCRTANTAHLPLDDSSWVFNLIESTYGQRPVPVE